MATDKIRKRNGEIFFRFSLGDRDSDIARRYHLTPGRINQLRREWEKEKQHVHPFFFVEYLDHSMVEGIDQKSPSRLAMVGQLMGEDDQACYFRQVWSLTKGTDIRKAIVIKNTITQKTELIQKRDKNDKQPSK